MKSSLLSIVTVFILCSSTKADAQSIFDKAENWLIDHNAALSYGPQYSWYKYSMIRIVQPEFDRDAELMYVEGRQTDNTAAIRRGKISTAQAKVAVNIELSEKYAMQLFNSHLNYEIITENDYHLRGTWDGEPIARTITTSEYINMLEHTNGLNFWGIGIKRNIHFINTEKVNFALGLMPNAAGVFTATQAQIYTPTGDLAYYDPGNKLAGLMIAGESSLTAIFNKHWVVGVNFNFFQSYIKKAHLDHQGYVSQRIRGSNYGLSIGYRL
jgi:hypothetical protein